MAVSRRRLFNARQNKRRSNVWRLGALALAKCSKCGECKLAHRVYGSYGYYNGRDVLKKGA